MNYEYFTYKRNGEIAQDSNAKLSRRNSLKCYHCNSSYNFDLVNNRCNNCEKIVGFSKYTKGNYTSVSELEIPSKKKEYYFRQKERRYVKVREKDEDEERAPLCYCLII